MELFAALVAGSAVFLFAAYVIRSRAAAPAETRLRSLVLEHESATTSAGGGEQRFLRREASGFSPIRRFLASSGYADRWTFDLERAGLQLRAGEYLLIRGMLAVVGFALAVAIGRNALTFFLGLIIGAVLFMVPALWLKWRIDRRISAIEKQLVEAVTLISGALRSGFAFAQALSVAAERLGPPISVEFSRLLLDINLGASAEEALRSFDERLGSDDVDMVVTAILIQRSTGGNLAEVLDSVTEMMRDRERLRGEIKTMTTQQQLTGWVLSIYPVALAGVFFLIAPSMMKLLFTTAPGLVLSGIWLLLNLTGILMLRRILRIDI